MTGECARSGYARPGFPGAELWAEFNVRSVDGGMEGNASKLLCFLKSGSFPCSDFVDASSELESKLMSYMLLEQDSAQREGESCASTMARECPARSSFPNEDKDSCLDNVVPLFLADFVLLLQIASAAGNKEFSWVWGRPQVNVKDGELL